MIKQAINRNHCKYLGFLVMLLLIIFSLTACGKSKYESADGAGSTGSSSPAMEKPKAADKNNSNFMDQKSDNNSGTGTTSTSTSTSTSTNSNPALQTGHKIIRTGEIGLETLKFDETVTGIQNYVNSIGGYIQSSSVQGKGVQDNSVNTSNTVTSKRNGTFIFRVPESKYSDFFTSIKGYGSITYQQSRGEDVTDQYFDTESRVKSLTIQEERILEILKKTDKLTDIIELEKRLSDIRYQIDSLTGTLKKWDNLVSFSTITLQIQEVNEITKVAPEKSKGLIERISFGFTNSMKNLGSFVQSFIVIIFTILPFLVVLALIGFLALSILKKYKKARNSRNNGTSQNIIENLGDNPNSDKNDSENS